MPLVFAGTSPASDCRPWKAPAASPPTIVTFEPSTVSV
jgi:hypothetical protein